MILTRLAAALSLLLKLGSVWFVLVALLGLRRTAPYPRCAPTTRFACIVAARNEEAVIGALVESLRGQSYPPELYDVYVAPNNCADGTEAAARAAGARILRCTGPVRCKGDVLHQAVGVLLGRRYDAFCVFDADNVVHTDFLSRMNDAFCAGARVAKGRMTAKNPGDSWVAGCYALYFGLGELFFNRPRAALGLSAKLVGTGFAVHRDVLTELGGWNTATIAEDAEFSAQCALRSQQIWWVPEALTYDEAPSSFRVSLRQRLRWCSGIMAVGRRHLPALARTLRRAPLARTADMILFLCAPFLQVLSLLPPLLLSAALTAEALHRALIAAPVTLLGSYLAVTLLAVIIARRSGLRCGSAVVLFAVFMASWLPLQVAALLRPATVWHEIRHSRRITAGELSSDAKA